MTTPNEALSLATAALEKWNAMFQDPNQDAQSREMLPPIVVLLVAITKREPNGDAAMKARIILDGLKQLGVLASASRPCCICGNVGGTMGRCSLCADDEQHHKRCFNKFPHRDYPSAGGRTWREIKELLSSG